MDSEDGELFVKQLATFVRTHEKALANALQLRKQNGPRHGASHSVSSVTTNGLTSPTVAERPATSGASSSNGLASALSFGALNFTAQAPKSAKLALTPHHLFYLLSRFEDLGIPVGPMKIRLENLHDNSSSANYVSFLSQSQRSKTGASEVGSVRSVSSMRSVMSGMSSLWSNFGIGSGISAARTERQKAALQADLKYLYSAFTKIPCLRLAPDWRARLIKGYEEFPFDSAVPLHVFKNCQALEVSDIDFRQFFGWDRMADQLRSLTLKRASIEDPGDLLIDIVLDDMDKRRRRTSKQQKSSMTPWPSTPRRSMTFATAADLPKTTSAPGSPGTRATVLDMGSPGSDTAIEDNAARYARRKSLAVTTVEPPSSPTKASSRPRSHSPRRPASSRQGPHHVRSSHKIQRSGSGSSQSSLSDSWYPARGSMSNFPATTILPSSKWRFLRHLSLVDNSLTSIPAASFAPLSNTLYSLDLSNNLFKEIPDSLATLTALRALNLSKCMIESLHSLTRYPLPAITALNLRENRLDSLAGIERLYPLERLDLRENRLKDPVELARLTNIPDIREIWVEGNPFTKTHKDYRITIFNLFRQSPGYTEDPLIDMAGPTSSEKRYLVERTKEPLPVPVIKPAIPEVKAVDVSKPTIIYDAPPPKGTVLRKERPSPKAVASETNTTSTRSRRKAPRRRIVDLADTTKPLPAQPLYEDVASPGVSSPENNYRISQNSEIHQKSPSQEENRGAVTRGGSRIDTSLIPKLPPVIPTQDIGSPTSWSDSRQWDMSGEMYRRKIDSLRSNVGDGYLGALREEHWDANGSPHFETSPFSLSASPIHSNAASPGLHTGRTLGAPELSSVAT